MIDVDKLAREIAEHLKLQTYNLAMNTLVPNEEFAELKRKAAFYDESVPLGKYQQAKSMADVVCELFDFDYDSTSPNDIRNAIEGLSQSAETLPLTPILGPPDLEGVEDGSYFILPYDGIRLSITHTDEFGQHLIEGRGKIPSSDYARCKWHIGPFVITPPAEAEEMPKCPWCSDEMVVHLWELNPYIFVTECVGCGACGPREHTKQSAIAAAKGAGT